MLISHSVFSQTNKFGDKKVEKWQRQADKYIPEFHRDSIISVYPIYYLCTQKKYRRTKFDKIPTYSEIDPLMDYNHLQLDEILVKTTNGIWRLDGFDSMKKIYSYSRNNNSDIRLFNYLDSVKADKVYFLFGCYWCILIEKNGRKMLRKKSKDTYIECDIADVFVDEYPFNNVDNFILWYFSRKIRRSPPVIGY
jgi:hypothetical protein